MLGSEVTGPLRMAVVKGKKLIVKLTLDDLDEIVAFEQCLPFGEIVPQLSPIPIWLLVHLDEFEGEL